MQRNLALLGAVVLSDALVAPGWLPVAVGKNSLPAAVLGKSSLARGDSRRGLGCTEGRGADTVDDAARAGTVSPRSLIPGDILAASRKRAAEASSTMRMSKLIGRAAPSGWTEGVEFVTGQGDAAAFSYNDMCLVGGKFARILSLGPDEAGMLCVETKHAVSDTAGSSETRYLGPTVLGKLAPGVAEEACRHHGVV